MVNPDNFCTHCGLRLADHADGRCGECRSMYSAADALLTYSEDAFSLWESDKNVLSVLGGCARWDLCSGKDQYAAMCFDGSISRSSNPEVPHIQHVIDNLSCITQGVYVSYRDAELFHTERVLLNEFEGLVNRYISLVGTPRTVFLYTYLIPCDRDGEYGHCAQALRDFILDGPGRHYRWVIGWGNPNIMDQDERDRVRQILSELIDSGRVSLYGENELQITEYIGSKAPFGRSITKK